MPYQAGSRLPGERGSKLGHLDVLNSELVNSLIKDFEFPSAGGMVSTTGNWVDFNSVGVQPLRLIISVDGSMQALCSDRMPKRELAFVKTALLRLDPRAVSRLDPEYPHPLHLKNLMRDAALYHATVFPLKNISFFNQSNYDAVRCIVRDSLKDRSLQGIPHETLKWLAYQKWTQNQSIRSPSFECPHCNNVIQGLPYDSDEYDCEHCGQIVFISDMIGFHLEMGEDSAPASVATSYMLIHETLMLFSFIRHYWESGWTRDLSEALFIKDGPLTLRSQYSKLVPLLRNFLDYSNGVGVPIHIMGQEKTGVLVDHLDTFANQLSPHQKGDSPSYSILSHITVQRDIYRTHAPINPYGSRTNYGEKIFVKLDPYHQIVVSVPTGRYNPSNYFPSHISDFIGLDRILATLPSIVSYRHQSALVPIELANGVASLSSYPSASVLKIFAGLDR